MKSFFGIALLVIAVAAFGCKSKKPVVEQGELVEVINAEPAPVTDFIKISKSGCLGPCSIYDLTVWRDGRADFKGIDNVPRKGAYSSRVPEPELIELWNAVDKVAAMEFEAEYQTQVMDVQLITLTWDVAGDARKVR